MYWGVFTGIIIPSLDTKVSTKLHLFFTFFCAYSLIFHSFYISQKTTVFFRIFFCDFLQFIKKAQPIDNNLSVEPLIPL